MGGFWRGLLVLAALTAAGAIAQTLYKWVDEKGVTHYSETPPPDRKTPVREIAPPMPPAQRPSSAPGTKTWQQQEEEFSRRHQARQQEFDRELNKRRRARDAEDFLKTIPVPGQTAADPGLQARVLEGLLMLERAADPDCLEHRVADTELLDMSRAAGRATERWTVQRCGTPVRYRVAYQCPFGHSWDERCGTALLRD